MLIGAADEAALFTFDSKLQEVVVVHDRPRARSGASASKGKPWGMTSLYDAIGADGAERWRERANRHRALLVITDGVDTGSRMSAPEVSGIASSIDVPVYLLTVVNPLDHPGGEFAVLATDGATTEHGDAGRPGALDRRRHAHRERAQRTRSKRSAICSRSCGISTSSPSSRGRVQGGTRSRFGPGRRT